MVIEDIVNNPDPLILNIIEKELQSLSDQKLYNIKNYKTLLDEVSEYDCFHVLIEQNTLIAFSGLYSKRWGNIGRALQRTYKNPMYRRKGLGYNSSTDNMQHLWSDIFTPLQISFAKQIELDAIFVTTEFPRRWKSLNRFTERLNGTFTLLPDMYFVCNKHNKQGKYIGSHLEKTCWQNVTLCTLNNNYTFDLDSMTHEEWKEHFEN